MVGLTAASHVTLSVCLFQPRPFFSHLARNFKFFSLQKQILLVGQEVLEVLGFLSYPWLLSQGVPLGFVTPRQVLTRGASTTGAVLTDQRTWSESGSHLHIKLLEADVVFRSSRQVSRRGLSWFRRTTAH